MSKYGDGNDNGDGDGDGDDYNCGLNMGWVTGGRWYRGCKELTLRIIWGR